MLCEGGCRIVGFHLCLYLGMEFRHVDNRNIDKCKREGVKWDLFPNTSEIPEGRCVFISVHTKISLGVSGMLLLLFALLVVCDRKHDVHIYFSEKSGFYDEAFELVVFGGNGNNIYYTLDGSEPTGEDFLFDRKDPIYIDDATKNENIYAARTDISSVDFSVPDYLLDKCNVVRASVFDEEGVCLDSITGVYFVGYQNKEGYDNIYTASLVTEPEYLFDYNTGIYVKGEAFDNPQMQEGQMSSRRGNYSYSGAEWEREAELTVFDDKKRVVLSQDCGIRIKGGYSRVLPQKSVSCYARTEYAGSRFFSADLFQTGILPHKIVLFSGGNDKYYKILDYVAQNLEKNLGFATLDFIPCILFLNGEYWGACYITEDYNADYISGHYNVARDNIIMVKVADLEEGQEGDLEFYYQLEDEITYDYMWVPENYERACELIDMDGYIDYYAAQIYIGRNGDWPNANYALWRTRENEGSPYGDCRWRWMLFDVNSGGLGLGVLNDDTLQMTLEKDPMFNSLYQNDEFRRSFAKRILEIGKEVYSIEQCNALLDEWERIMRAPIGNTNRRFYSLQTEEGFDKAVENVKSFVAQRYDKVWDMLVDHMGEDWLAQNGISK